MRITEAERTRVALELIEDISADAQLLDPKRDWKQSYRAVIKIYQLVHSVRAPGCRENHPKWIRPIDAAIKAEKLEAEKAEAVKAFGRIASRQWSAYNLDGGPEDCSPREKGLLMYVGNTVDDARAALTLLRGSGEKEA